MDTVVDTVVDTVTVTVTVSVSVHVSISVVAVATDHISGTIPVRLVATAH